MRRQTQFPGLWQRKSLKMPLTRVSIPTTETTPKDVPDLTSDEIPLPSDLKTVLLAGLFLFAALTAANVAAEVILPIVLAIVLTLLLQPGMRLLSRLHFPRSLSALLLILAALTGVFALGAAVSGPAKTWAERLPQGIPLIEEKLRFVSRPIQTASEFLQKSDRMGQQGPSSNSGLGITESLFRGNSTSPAACLRRSWCSFSFLCPVTHFCGASSKSCLASKTSGRRSISPSKSKTIYRRIS
jgi:AI-2E family transporter